jgi:glycosyltransferase involved in cell wall biosynthesis
LRRVLFLAYYFPPRGGGGVQRSLKFCRYLPAHGWAATVVTGPEGSQTDWGPSDVSLAGDVPVDVEVRRVPGPEPAVSGGLRSRSIRWLRLEEQFSRWWVEGSIAAGRGVLGDAEAICASMSPFETGTAAARLARESGKPWIADLRDPWALDEWLLFPTRVHRWLELRRMRATLGSAAAVVMNTPEAALQVRRHVPELRSKPVVAIPNGFDAADFAGPRPERDDRAFRIVHAGNVFPFRDSRLALLGRRLLGGSLPGLEVDARSHLYLLEAVEALRAARPTLGSRVEVHLAGPLPAGVRAGLPPWVKAHGFLPHGETVALLRSADLLFLPMHGLPPGVRSRIVPGKTYEYLASRTPILAAVPEGDARDLLAESGSVFLCAPKEVGAMRRIVAEELERRERGAPAPAPREDVLRRYERRELTTRLVEVLDAVAGHEKRDEAPADPALAAG